MRRFFESGLAFLVVAVLCFVAGVLSEFTAMFMALGGFWMVMAIVVAGKSKADTSGDDQRNISED